MKLKFKFLFLNTFVANILFAQIFRNNPNYTPIFQDSFIGTALRPNVWDPLNFGNVYEPNVYNDTLFNVSNGFLNLFSRTAKNNSGTLIKQGIEFQSREQWMRRGRILTANYIHPERLDHLIAIWTFRGGGWDGTLCPAPNNFCDYAEIDMVETKLQENTNTCSVHSCSNIGCGHADINQINNINVPPFGYTLSAPLNMKSHSAFTRLDNTHVTIGIDGIVARKVPAPVTPIRPITAPSGSAGWATGYDAGMWIRLTHVSKQNTLAENSNNVFSINFIGVYEPVIANCAADVNSIPNYNTFVYGLRRSFNLDGNSNIPANRTGFINLIAVDRFDFNNGFEIGENSEVELTLMNCQ